MAKRLLITGFDPFCGATINPSWEAVKRLPDQIGEYELCKMEIPTIMGVSTETVLEKAAQWQPDVILCVGQAGGRKAVTPERIAVNIRDTKGPDNAGNCPKGERILEDGPAAYFSTVPVMAMAAAIAERGLPGEVSNSAGAFVCNDTLYLLLRHYAGTDTRVGFIHVPFLPEQGEPSLSLEDTIRALEAAIEVC